MRIGVFDSGIGGLTVLKELIAKYPGNEYIYFGDTLNIPYGTKTKEELLVLADKIINFLISKKVELIIIACGTISSNIYSEIKDKYNIEIIDILSPTINYLKNQNYSKVGVLATPMTAKSLYFEKHLSNVKSVGCPKLVPLIESGKINETDKYIKEYLNELTDVQAIVLGCTHYPVLIPVIRKYSSLPLINMGKCLVDTLSVNKTSTLHIKLYFSKLTPEIITNICGIIKENKEIIERKL